MELRTARFVVIMLAALSLSVGIGHLMQLPARMGYIQGFNMVVRHGSCDSRRLDLSKDAARLPHICICLLWDKGSLIFANLHGA